MPGYLPQWILREFLHFILRYLPEWVEALQRWLGL